MTTASKTHMKYRADHVGSLLRPPELLKARAEHLAGRMSADDLRKLEDKFILEAMAMQKSSGISVLSDGEYRRGGWAEAWQRVTVPFTTPVNTPATSGFVVTPNQWKGFGSELVQPAANAQQRRVVDKKIDPSKAERIAAHEASFLKQHAGGYPFKVTMPGVGQFMGGNQWEDGITSKVYKDRRAMGLDLAKLMKKEITSLISEGVPYIQMDSLRYIIQIADPTRRAQMIKQGLDPDKELEETIEADNAAIDGIDRKGSVIALHMCKGNNRSAWLAEGSYDAVAEKTFAGLKVERLLLEYDDERSGGFEVLRFLPKNKQVVLGIVSSKLAQQESVDFLRRRLDEAAKYFPLENMAISPQCGFASMAPGNLLTWDDQKRKLELCAEAARKVWGSA